MTTLRIHLWQDHSPWSVLLTLLHLTPLPQQQQQLLGQSWLLLVPRPSCSFSGGSLYSKRQRTPVLAERARVQPPKNTPEIMSKESWDKGGKNRGWEEG